MAERGELKVREMVKEAVVALGGDTTNVAVRDWVQKKYPGTNTRTINCQIIVLSVNNPSRVYYGQNRKPRQAKDDRYDLLYRPDPGRVRLYDPERDGIWQIFEREDGSLTVGLTDGEDLKPNVENEQNVFAAEAQLRGVLAANLKVIEDGLELYVDDGGDTGVEFTTSVGRIDLLAVDRSGNLAVIELKVGRPPDAVVGQLMRYMGWVKIHLAEGRQVRGIIVAASISDQIRYAVSNLQGVSLKEYKMHLTVQDAAGLDVSPS